MFVPEQRQTDPRTHFMSAQVELTNIKGSCKCTEGNFRENREIELLIRKIIL